MDITSKVVCPIIMDNLKSLIKSHPDITQPGAEQKALSHAVALISLGLILADDAGAEVEAEVIDAAQEMRRAFLLSIQNRKMRAERDGAR